MTETSAATLEAGAPSDSAARTERLIAIGMVVVPTFFTLVAFALALAHGVSTLSIVLFAVFYVITSAGVEIGMHRYFSHRAFKCGKAVRLGLGIAGSMAGQGPVLFWATTHRRHHRHSDTDQDPHSPIGHGVRGIWRSHLGWLFEEHRFEPGREVPDLVRDHATMLASRHYLSWYALGILIPGLIGLAVTGTLYGGLEGALWGGFVRVFAVHQVTWSVNSLCHLVGRKPWKSRDESRNLALLALPTLGGSWHNNHHAFPASATTSLAWWQFDPSGWIIRGAEAAGLVWDVRRPPPKEHREARSR